MSFKLSLLFSVLSWLRLVFSLIEAASYSLVWAERPLSLRSRYCSFLLLLSALASFTPALSVISLLDRSKYSREHVDERKDSAITIAAASPQLFFAANSFFKTLLLKACPTIDIPWNFSWQPLISSSSKLPVWRQCKNLSMLYYPKKLPEMFSLVRLCAFPTIVEKRLLPT